jgi:hypothetical protein
VSSQASTVASGIERDDRFCSRLGPHRGAATRKGVNRHTNISDRSVIVISRSSRLSFLSLALAMSSVREARSDRSFFRRPASLGRVTRAWRSQFCWDRGGLLPHRWRPPVSGVGAIVDVCNCRITPEALSAQTTADFVDWQRPLARDPDRRKQVDRCGSLPKAAVREFLRPSRIPGGMAKAMLADSSRYPA